MTSSMFKDILKTLNTKMNRYYAGKLDAKYENSICVYSLKTSRQIAIGGNQTTKTKIKSFSILIHGNKNHNETEILANNIYTEISNIQQVDYIFNNTNYHINYIEMLNGGSVDLHEDNEGVYERLIDINIYYNN